MNRRGFIKALLAAPAIPLVVKRKSTIDDPFSLKAAIRNIEALKKAMNAHEHEGIPYRKGLIPENLDRDIRKVTFTKKHLKVFKSMGRKK